MKGRSLIPVAIAMLFGSVSVAHAQSPGKSREQGSIRLAVASQPIAAALNEFARQSGLHVVIASDVAAGVKSAPVEGTYTPKAALEQMLKDTGLRYEYLDSSTVAVLGKGKPQAALDGRPGLLRLAQNDLVSGQSSSTSTASQSQDAGEFRKSALEEVIVTAQKREERLIDVPISIVTMDADELQKRRVTTIDELAMTVPGLVAQSNGGYQRTVSLRGIGNPIGASSLIGVYLDEAAVTGGLGSQLDLQVYDLERVEVLRGPQGTLYGDGSAGGTVRFLTRDPELDGFRFGSNLELSSTQDGGDGERVEAMVNVPVVADQLGLRIAGIYDHEAGWIDQPAAGVEDFNRPDLVDVRVKTLWQPVDQFTANLMAVIHRNNGAFSNGEDDAGNYTQTFNLTTTPEVEDDYDLYNLTLSYDFSSARLLSTTSHIDHVIDVRNLGSRRLRAAPPAPLSSGHVPSDVRARRGVTQELRLTSMDPGPWQWTFGGYYRRHRFSEDIPLQYSGFAGPPGTPLPASFPPFHQDTLSEAWAAFGDMSYKFMERLTLGAGLRYFHEDQTSNNNGVIQEGDFNNTSPRLYAQYKVTSAMSLYASAAEGFRSGGFNTASQPPYGPETVRTYELGSKMLLADGRFSFDAALFYSDYENYQIFGNLPPPGPTLAFFSNAGSARIEGIEWGLAWRPAKWQFSFTGNYVDSEFYEMNVTAAAYNVGDPIDMIPEYQYTVSTQRNFDWSGRAGFARLDYSEQGREVFRNRRTGPWFFGESDVINLLHANLGVQWSKSVSFGVFATNLLNDRGYTSPLALTESAARSRPRTYGIEFGVTFD